MARTNKYASINFNDIYEKVATSNNKPHPSSKHPSSSPYSSSSASSPLPYSAATSPHNAFANASSPYKAHLTQGRMLVLTRPAPKPITVPPSPSAQPQPQTQPQPNPSPPPAQNRPESDSDPISLRPLGKTGTGSVLSSPIPVIERDKEVVCPVASPKPDKFVPPHLRPGFAGKEERSRPEVPRQAGSRVRESVQRQQGHYGSPVPYGEDGRPKSGGYERMRRSCETDLNRTGLFVNRPSSSG